MRNVHQLVFLKVEHKQLSTVFSREREERLLDEACRRRLQYRLVAKSRNLDWPKNFADQKLGLNLHDIKKEISIIVREQVKYFNRV